MQGCKRYLLRLGCIHSIVLDNVIGIVGLHDVDHWRVLGAWIGEAADDVVEGPDHHPLGRILGDFDGVEVFPVIMKLNFFFTRTIKNSLF